MNNESVQSTRGFNVIFIHSSLDDSGLSPFEFRVFGHIARRASDGVCWASSASMASICCMCEDKVKKCLSVLESRNMVVRQNRPGLTTVFRIQPPGKWKMGNPPVGNPPVGNPPVGNPPEGNPSIKGILSIRGSYKKKETPFVSEGAESIYKLYPRKVSKPNALRAISKAVAKFGFKHIFEKTSEFAACWAGETDLTYCPHPATWFNGERFNDEKSTWKRNNGVSRPVRNVDSNQLQENITCKTVKF